MKVGLQRHGMCYGGVGEAGLMMNKHMQQVSKCQTCHLVSLGMLSARTFAMTVHVLMLCGFMVCASARYSRLKAALDYASLPWPEVKADAKDSSCAMLGSLSIIKTHH